MSAHERPHTLASTDFLGDTEELRAEALRQLPPDADTRPPPRQSVTDDSGSLTVSVDARGHIEDVEIRAGWQHRLDPKNFASALFGAYTAARQQAVRAFAVARLAAEEQGVKPLDTGSVDSSHTLPPAPADPGSWSNWFRQALDSIQVDREEVARIRAAGAPQRHERTGPNGYLTATLRGREVTGITADAGTIRYADRAGLREDALDLLSSGNRTDDRPAGWS